MGLALIAFGICVFGYCALGLLCGLLMLPVWWRWRKTGKRHTLWKALWVGGRLILALSGGLWCLPDPWRLACLVALIGPGLWIVAVALYRWGVVPEPGAAFALLQ